ncbi:GNAT family N-acetyltransferase [Butyrivibrio sp. VCD2006]|uniref:GNAT family N-acetyltransferase n=1 Tax=Butyrivibrio sp. VCD2006 TaxID=1280664 RepID=UPI000406CFB0|nr:N-acetyltransferase [Butyrivibrio sp. VCD2006]
MEIIIRKETSNDFRKVEEATRQAFGYPERIERGGIGCPYEHWMVNELRKRDGVKDLSLVATVGGEIIGHVICSNAIVKNDENEKAVQNLGPISVLPQYQKQGVGKALINELIRNAKEQGHGAFLFFGRPEYYPQFGFVEAETFGISDSEGYNYPSFMGMELIPGYLGDVRGGRFYESDIYNDELNRNAVRRFDQQFID